MRVLFIDDEPDLRELLTITFEIDGGFDVVGSASTLDEGTDLARSLRPHVIVTDLVLGRSVPPEEMLAELRLAAPDAAIVLFSGKDMSTVAAAAGADAVVMKGGDIAELVATVREIAQGRSS